MEERTFAAYCRRISRIVELILLELIIVNSDVQIFQLLIKETGCGIIAEP